jgi:proline dehydrogenase
VHSIQRLLVLALLVAGLGWPVLHAEPTALVDRIAVVLGQDVITAREIEELASYLRYRRDHARSTLAKNTNGSLVEEAYEESITRALVQQRLKADPDFRLARGRARDAVHKAIETEGESTMHGELEAYGLTEDRFLELETLTVAIQDYVRAKFRYVVVPTGVQIEQYLQRHPELKKAVESLSDEGQAEVRRRIGQQLEFQNFLEQYKKFVDELRSGVQVTKVYVPEVPP